MRLKNVASRFDKLRCYDAYTPSRFAFNAQLVPYDDSKRDSETAARRVLSVSPSANLPARRVVSMGNARYILGQPQQDAFMRDEIRVGYVIQDAPDLATIKTLAQVCAGQAGTTAYAGRTWVKNLAFSEQGSDLAPEQHLYFSKTEVVADYSLITYQGKSLLARTSNLGTAGFLVVTADEMPQPCVETITVTTGAYDPVTQALAAGTAQVVAARLRWQSNFQHGSKMAPAFGPDEMQVAVGKAVTVTAGARLTMSDGKWLVASVVDTGVWLCRATRYGA